MRRRPPCEILWCPNAKNEEKRSGWSFPPLIEKKIRELCGDGSVVHLFGGRARFGVRLDIDPTTKPHVIGDAWLPPFAMASFETVVLDPPYFTMDREMLGQLMAAAAFVARSQVVWLHQLWAPSQMGLRCERGWMIRVGDNHYVRCLQHFRRTDRVVTPLTRFTRGPAMKYNRWLAGEMPLPFPPEVAIAKTSEVA
jgi:hypothetical protein